MLTNTLREVKNQNANTIKQTLSDNTDVTSYRQYTTGLIFSWNHMQHLIFKTKLPLAVKRYTLILGPAKKYKCASLAACIKKEKSHHQVNCKTSLIDITNPPMRKGEEKSTVQNAWSTGQ